MSSYNLTSEELLLVYLTLLARDEESHPEYFVQWFEHGGKNRLRDLFNSLKEKGVILKSYNPESYIPNEIEFNSRFLKFWTKYSGELGRELFEAYPPFININGRYVPLRDISKKFNSVDDFAFYYATKIGHNIDTHKEVMEILEWAKSNDLLNFGILNFVVSEQWKALKELRDNPEMIPTANSICTIDE